MTAAEIHGLALRQVKTTTRELWKRLPTRDELGRRSVPDGEEEITYQVEIDQRGLDQIARKAAGNRSGKSVDGPVKVSILSRRRLP